MLEIIPKEECDTPYIKTRIKCDECGGTNFDIYEENNNFNNYLRIICKDCNYGDNVFDVECTIGDLLKYYRKYGEE